MFPTTVFLFTIMVAGVFSAHVSDIPVYEKSNLYSTQLSSRINDNTPHSYITSQPMMQRFQTPMVNNQLNQLLHSSIISTYVELIEYAKMFAHNLLMITQNAYPLNIYHNNMDYSQNTLSAFQRLPLSEQLLLQIKQQQMDEQPQLVEENQYYDENEENSKFKLANNPNEYELNFNPVIEIQDRDLEMYEEERLRQKQKEELRQREEEELRLRAEEELRKREEELRQREEEELRLRAEEELRKREEELRQREEEELRLRNEEELRQREEEESRQREEEESRQREEEELRQRQEQLRLKEVEEEEELRQRQEQLRLKEEEEKEKLRLKIEKEEKQEQGKSNKKTKILRRYKSINGNNVLIN